MNLLNTYLLLKVISHCAAGKMVNGKTFTLISTVRVLF